MKGFVIIRECIAHCGGQIVNKGHCCKFVKQRLTIDKRAKHKEISICSFYNIHTTLYIPRLAKSLI